jgi:hypothetical protein
MRIAPWRLALTGAVTVSLVVAGVAAVMAGSSDPTADSPAAGAGNDGPGAAVSLFGRHRPLARLAAARHLVHLEVTVINRDGEIVEHHLDHGTLGSIGNGTLVIAEADGESVTIRTAEETTVRLGRTRGELADLVVGDEVVVHSRVEDGSVIAKHILRLPPARQ